MDIAYLWLFKPAQTQTENIAHAPYFSNLQYANKGIYAVKTCNIILNEKKFSHAFHHILRLIQPLVFRIIILQPLPRNKNKTLLMMLIYSKQRRPKIIMKENKKLDPSTGVVFIYI